MFTRTEQLNYISQLNFHFENPFRESIVAVVGKDNKVDYRPTDFTKRKVEKVSDYSVSSLQVLQPDLLSQKHRIASFIKPNWRDNEKILNDLEFVSNSRTQINDIVQSLDDDDTK
jgi:hypothetical protein